MTDERDPERLRKKGSPLQMALLRSTRSDGLNRQQRGRILAGLGVAGGLGLGGPAVAKLAGAAAGAGKAAQGIVVATKVVSVLLAGGALAVGGLRVVRSLGPNATTKPKAAQVAPYVNETAPMQAQPLAPLSVHPVTSQALPAQVGPRRHAKLALARNNAGSQAPLAAELASVEQIRAAVEAKDGAAALRRLANHRRAFRPNALGVEVDVLQIEALALAGQREAALQAGATFLRRKDGSPYTQRVQSLLKSLQQGDASSR
ncbi:MAG: hypothetical protein SF187_30960 [Deltaproteobacteria bacterium]|nr:hypothetical protein [Deltaproteobacteria bacterium]